MGYGLGGCSQYTKVPGEATQDRLNNQSVNQQQPGKQHGVSGVLATTHLAKAEVSLTEVLDKSTSTPRALSH